MLHGSRYFAPSEFACRCNCGFGMKEEHIAADLIHAMHTMRHAIGVPFKITSGARCAYHNIKVEGGKRSTHLPGGNGGPCTPEYTGQCRAADISTSGWSMETRAQLVGMALQIGLRVGIATDFVHVDVEQGPYYQDGLWNYGNKENSSGGD